MLLRGGMSWFGGLAGGLVAGLSVVTARRLPIVAMLAAASPALAAGHAIGRIGCFLVGDDYGRPSDLPWAVAFPEGLPPTVVPFTRHSCTKPRCWSRLSRCCCTGVRHPFPRQPPLANVPARWCSRKFTEPHRPGGRSGAVTRYPSRARTFIVGSRTLTRMRRNSPSLPGLLG